MTRIDQLMSSVAFILYINTAHKDILMKNQAGFSLSLSFFFFCSLISYVLIAMSLFIIIIIRKNTLIDMYIEITAIMSNIKSIGRRKRTRN
jgi:hypothetical protein